MFEYIVTLIVFSCFPLQNDFDEEQANNVETQYQKVNGVDCHVTRRKWTS